MVSVSYDAGSMEALSIDVLPAEEAVAQPREQAENETQATLPAEEPVMQPEEPVAEEPVATEPVAQPEEPVAEEPTSGSAEEVPGFEAYLALVAIGLAGTGVALSQRKKKE